jgi:undecaprenyl-diphosphatase
MAVLVVAALGVWGSGLVHPPNLEHVIKDVGSTLGKWTYLLVGVMAFLETGAFVGLIAPGEFTILLGGVVAGQGEINVVLLIAIVWTCAVAGDSVSFYAGHKLGRDFLVKHGPKVQITEPRLRQVEGFFARYGGPTILIGRFVGLVRAIAPFVAGASRMRYRRFLPFDIVGAGLWGSAFVMLGYIFWHSFDQVANIAGKGALALGTVIALVVGIVAAYRWLKVDENRARADAWLREQERKRVVGPVIRFARPAWSRVLRPASTVVSVPLRFLWQRVTPGGLGLELTTLLAAGMVGGFTFGALASYLHTHVATSGDSRAFEIADKLHSKTVDDAVKVFTDLGSLPVVAVVVVLAMVFLVGRRRVVEGLTLLIGFWLTVLGVNIAKAAEDRPRPLGSLVGTEGSSFPSGHSAYAIAYIAIAFAFWHAFPGVVRRTVVVTSAVVLTAAIGASRIHLHAHYLSDVLGGFGLGAAIFAACGIVGLVVSHLRQNGQPEPVN